MILLKKENQTLIVYTESIFWCVYLSGILLQSNYVICKVTYKGVDGDSLFGNNSKSNELRHSMVCVSNTARGINTTPEVSSVSDMCFSFSLVSFL